MKFSFDFNAANKKVFTVYIRGKEVFAVLADNGKILQKFNSLIPEDTDFEQGLGSCLETILENIDTSGAVCAVCFPADYVYFRNIEVPFSDPKKIEKIIYFELEPLMPLPIDELLIDFAIIEIPLKSKATHVLAGAVEKKRIESYLNILSSYQIDPQILTINGYFSANYFFKKCENEKTRIFADFRGDSIILFAGAGNSVCIVRSLTKKIADMESAESVCTCIRQTFDFLETQYSLEFGEDPVFAALYDEEKQDFVRQVSENLNIPIEKSDIEYPVEDGLRGCLNFRKREFAFKKKWTDLKKSFISPAILAAVILPLALVSNIVEITKLSGRVENLDQQITRIFKNTLPEIKRIVDPLQQMRVQLKILKKESHIGTETEIRAIDIINEISGLIPAATDIEITRMNIGGQTLLLAGNADTFNTVDSIKNNLGQSKFFKEVEISSAAQDRTTGRVNFKLKAQL